MKVIFDFFEKRKILFFISIAALAVAVFFLIRSGGKESGFFTETIQKRDLKNIVSATGTLYASGSVEVGTQTSGTISRVLVDFNDHVKKGQLLAVIDRSLCEIALKETKAALVKAKSEYEFKVKEFDTDEKLFNKELISEYELDSARLELNSALSSYTSAEASYERAQKNLEYTEITSPIDGTVIDREVEPGQTVAASLSTPTLFIIAEDLEKMEIHALVDECDIGMIKKGQDITFTVEAYPDDEFDGTISEVRLQPATVDNVVNYTVVCDIRNSGNRLMPGMTATVDFIVENREDVFSVSNKAFSFTPDEEILKGMMKEMKKRMEDGAGKGTKRPGGPGAGMTGPGRSDDSDVKVIWIMEEGKVRPARVTKGITDGTYTEVESELISEGTEVITGADNSGRSKKEQETNNNNRPPMMRPF